MIENADARIVYGKPVPQFKMLHYLSLLNDSYLSMWFANEALKQNQEKLFQVLFRPPKILDDSTLYIGSDPESTKRVLLSALEERTRENTGKYSLIMQNLTAVLFCTALEICMDGVLDAIFTTKPETLLSFAQTIALKTLIEDQDYHKSLQRVREKAIFNFNHESIDRRFGFFGQKLGLSQEEVFNWSNYTDDVQKRLQDKNLDTVSSIFRKRYSVVHEGALPFAESEEIDFIREFFEKIIMNLCERASRKFKVPLDMLGYYAAWMPPPAS